MKKFSWILALLLALSLAFIGCPAPDEGGSKGGGEDGPSGPTYGPSYNPDEPPFTLNPAATDLSVAFSAANVLAEKADGKTHGSLKFVDTTGYTYIYGSKVLNGDGKDVDNSIGDDKYGNAIVRFKVDLGATKLANYGSVTFKWKANGYSDDGDNVTSGKNLYLLASASDEEGAVTPWLGDDDIKAVIASSNYFDDIHLGEDGKPAGNNFWNSNAPRVNGDKELEITLPIVHQRALTGEVWFAVYVHAGNGAYTISDVKFIASEYAGTGDDAYGTVVGDTTDAAKKPYSGPPGDKSFNFNLDLSDWQTAGTSEGGLNPNVPTGTFANGKLTVTFEPPNANNQRVNIKLTDEQVKAIKEDRNSDYFEVTIVGTVISGTGDNFRYHIGDPSLGGGWNFTDSFDAGPLATVLVKTINYNRTATPPTFFMLQHRSADAVTIEITSINIKTVAAPATLSSIAVKTQPTKATYENGIDKFEPAGLVITTTWSDATTRDVTYAAGAGFTFKDGSADLTVGTSTFGTDGAAIPITVAYQGKTTTFNIKVESTITVTSIAVKTPPTKVAYTTGITPFDPTGLVITVTPSAGAATDVTYTATSGFTFKVGSDALAVGAKFSTAGSKTVTVTAHGKDATFSVTVTDPSGDAVNVVQITFDQSWSGIDLLNSFFSFAEGDLITAKGTIIAATGGDDTTDGSKAEFVFNDKPGAWGVPLYQKTGAKAGVDWEFTDTALTATMIANIASPGSGSPSGIRIAGNNVKAQTLIITIEQIKITRGSTVLVDLATHLQTLDIDDANIGLILPGTMGFQPAGNVTAKVIAKD